MTYLALKFQLSAIMLQLLALSSTLCARFTRRSLGVGRFTRRSLGVGRFTRRSLGVGRFTRRSLGVGRFTRRSLGVGGFTRRSLGVGGRYALCDLLLTWPTFLWMPLIRKKLINLWTPLNYFSPEGHK